MNPEEKAKIQEEGRKKRKRRLEIRAGIILTFAVLLITFSFYFYQVFFWPNFLVRDDSPEEAYLYIPTGANFSTVMDSLKANKYVNNPPYFAFLSQLMKYQDNVKPGRYLLKEKQNNYDVIKKLKSGEQTPLNVTFNNIRTLEQLTQVVSEQIEASDRDIMKAAHDTAFLEKHGLDSANIISMFIPNTYEFYWTTSGEEFVERMEKEYENFWNEARLKKAEDLNMTPAEVAVLASIVEAETQQNAEKATIAGVYLNRINKGMRLQADPTVKHAIGDPGRRRILDADLKFDSPYNTYMYKGLPPGPINLPSITSIDAVLNAEEHKYLYFVASVNNPGFHDFSVTHAEHERKAAKYRRYLSKQGILK